jgi:hypothetical protein
MTEAITTGCYLVACPALNEREICYGIDHANDVCYSMHKDSGGAAQCKLPIGHWQCIFKDVDGIIYNANTDNTFTRIN